MENSFWQQAWREERTGFHQTEFNKRLTRYFPTLDVPKGATVLVPLCGKSLDMLWLRDAGYRVVGVELSRRAVEAFCEENDLHPEVDRDGPFERFHFDNLTILIGDIFDVRPGHLGEIGGLYDRAALVALPTEMRARYAAHIGRLLPAGTAGLLLTIDYDQSEMEGPPFSVGDSEVAAIFGERFSVERLASIDVLDRTRFRDRLTGLTEQIYALRRSASDESPDMPDDTGALPDRDRGA